jgi:hypothetical protein
MRESPKLVAARERLSRAEAQYRTKEGLLHLGEGLALLEEVMAGEPGADQDLARNLASAYSGRIHRAIRKQIDEDPALPEPELEHLFQVILALDQCSVELPVEAGATKAKLARHLIELYYEGHSPEAKRAALEQLAAVTGSSRTKRATTKTTSRASKRPRKDR